VENRLAPVDRRKAVLRPAEDWFRKSFVAGSFKKPPFNEFRMNGMILIVKEKRIFFFSVVEFSKYFV
jgi:hypothetical protein